MRVERSLFIDAPPEAVFDLVSDPKRWAEFGVGLTRWEPKSKRTKGKGAKFKALVKVGSIEAGGLVRVTEWQKNRVIEWRSEQGIDQSGRWLLRPVEGGGTELTLHLEFALVGPFSGLVERMAARVLGRNMEASLLAARRIVESKPGSRTGASDSDYGHARTPGPARRSLLSRSLDMLNPKVFATLRRAGVLSPAGVVAAAGAAPWYVGRGPSLGIVSQLNAVSLPRKQAVRDRAGAVSWLELDARANRLVHVLQDLGVGPKDRVALLLRNGRECAEALIACQKVGIIAAPFNTFAKPAELRAAFEGTAPRALIYDVKHADQVTSSAPDRVKRIVVGSDGGPIPPGERAYEDALHEASPAPPLPYAREKGSARIVIHTSGTTGKPKGAARDSSVMGIREFIGLLDAVPLRRDDVVLVPAPMFHSFGLLTFTLGCLLGVTFVMPERFDPEETLRLIQEHRATAVAMVPVMIHRVLSLPDEVKARYDVSSVRILLASGSAIPQDLRAEIDLLFPEALYDLYGSTEAGWVAIATPEAMASHPGSVGKPVWGVDVAVFSPEGTRLGPGETGEIHVRSGALFEGYTSGEQKASREGFVALGDLGHLDEEGYLSVEGRADDMVVVGGENVYPAEVEAVIRGLPDVKDVAVFGVPDKEYGEVLAAFVVGGASPEAVREACKSELASFKVPRRVETVDELPRTSTGKVMKRELIPLVESA